MARAVLRWARSAAPASPCSSTADSPWRRIEVISAASLIFSGVASDGPSRKESPFSVSGNGTGAGLDGVEFSGVLYTGSWDDAVGGRSVRRLDCPAGNPGCSVAEEPMDIALEVLALGRRCFMPHGLAAGGVVGEEVELGGRIKVVLPEPLVINCCVVR